MSVVFATSASDDKSSSPSSLRFPIPPSSVELWAASKIVGRDCAMVNRALLLCKQQHDFPGNCINESLASMLCAENIVKESRQKFDIPYTKYQVCLDRNNWRHFDCRKEQNAFLDLWNQNKMKASA